MNKVPSTKTREFVPKGQQWTAWGPLAEHLFVEQGLRMTSVEQRLAAEYQSAPRDIAPPTRGSLYRWAEIRNWNQRRADFNKTTLPIQGQLYKTLSTTVEKLGKSNDTELYNLSLTLRNIMASLKDLKAEEQVEPLLRMFLHDLVDFAASKAPELAAPLKPCIASGELYGFILQKRVLSARGGER